MDGRSGFHVESLHSQIADDLIRRIASGTLAAGSTLPLEEVHAAEYGVSIRTLQQALDHVANLRLVERRGRVTRVSDVESRARADTTISTSDEHGNRIVGDTVERNVRVETPSVQISRLLRQRTPKPVLRFDRFRSHRGRRYMIEDVYLPVRHTDLDGDRDHIEGLARDLWWKREVAQAKHEKLWLDKASDADGVLLGIPAGETVLCIARTLFGARNLPLEYRLGRCSFGPDLFHVSD